MGVKQEMEAAAIAGIKCPSCDAEPGAKCHYTGRHLDGSPAFPNSVVKTHQRRMSAFVATRVSFTDRTDATNAPTRRFDGTI